MLQRGWSHEKVSAIAALVVSPRRDNVRLFFRLHPDENIKTPLIDSFLRQMSRQLGKKSFLVVWDRLNAHRAKAATVFRKGSSRNRVGKRGAISTCAEEFRGQIIAENPSR